MPSIDSLALENHGRGQDRVGFIDVPLVAYNGVRISATLCGPMKNEID